MVAELRLQLRSSLLNSEAAIAMEDLFTDPGVSHHLCPRDPEEGLLDVIVKSALLTEPEPEINMMLNMWSASAVVLHWTSASTNLLDVWAEDRGHLSAGGVVPWAEPPGSAQGRCVRW